jgi:hypothetical protein
VRLRIERVELLGADRSVEFSKGLNIITGPIATGKTTLVRLLRFLIGASLGNLPPEAKQTVSSVTGRIVLGDQAYSIVRPAVSTTTARVEIAGDTDLLRLAAGSGEELTYTEWLLEKLDLPRLRVPSAPSRPESEPTPVSINDYLLYLYLSQEDLGFSVFGHRDTFKNIKRRYVFDIIYGFYDVRAAQLQEELRSVLGQLRTLQSQTELFRSFFEDTALANRAALEHELTATRTEIASLESDWGGFAQEASAPSATAELQARVLALEEQYERTRGAIAAEQVGIGNLDDMVAQLESQSGKLTRAIVAGKHLVDFEFIVCPRCGASIKPDRAATTDTCDVCLQTPAMDFSKESLIREQGAVEAQLTEAQDLLKERHRRLNTLHRALSDVDPQLKRERVELDFLTRTYVSERADRIASLASRRSSLKARERQLHDYIVVLNKLDDAHRRIAQLSVNRSKIEHLLGEASTDAVAAAGRVRMLEETFNELLERFEPPHFGEELTSSIDRSTYLPIYHGRRFDDLSSPGLATLVNVAHAIAHQITSLKLKLKLPNMLIIDGLSEHLGKEGLDPVRLSAVYDALIDVSNRFGSDLQLIVVDNEVPDIARSYVRLELAEDQRLIPETVLPT